MADAQQMDNSTGQLGLVQASDRRIGLTTQTLGAVEWPITFLGILGNSFVMFVIVTSKPMRKNITNIFIFNQSFIDALASLMLLVSSGIDYGIIFNPSMRERWPCKLFYTRLQFWSLAIASSYNLLFLNVDRYVAIVHPLSHRAGYGRKKLAAMLLFPWLFGIVFSCVTIIPSSDAVTVTDDNGKVDWPECKLYALWINGPAQIALGVTLLLCQCVIPFSVIIYCHSRITFVLRRRARSNQSSGVQNDKHQPNEIMVLTQNTALAQMSKAERNSVKTAFIISIAFIICWALYTVAIFMEFILLTEDDANSTYYADDFYSAAYVTIQINCCVNPFIYAFTYKPFQTAVSTPICVLECQRSKCKNWIWA